MQNAAPVHKDEIRKANANTTLTNHVAVQMHMAHALSFNRLWAQHPRSTQDTLATDDRLQALMHVPMHMQPAIHTHSHTHTSQATSPSHQLGPPTTPHTYRHLLAHTHDPRPRNLPARWCMSISACTHTRIHICTYIYMYIHIHTYTNTYNDTCMFTCVCV